jgi:hypothetical protein
LPPSRKEFAFCTNKPVLRNYWVNKNTYIHTYIKMYLNTLALTSFDDFHRGRVRLDRFRKDDATSKTTWMSSFGANYRQLLVCHVVLDDFTTRKCNFHVLSRTSQIYASFEKNMRVCMIKITLFCSSCIV